MAEFYDTTELANYLARVRGEGITPEFTNVPGAIGPNTFLIDSPPRSDAELQEEDEIIEDRVYPAPHTYTNLELLQEDILTRQHELEDETITTINATKEKYGIPQLEARVQTLIAAGLGESEEAKYQQAELNKATTLVSADLGMNEKGQLISGPLAEKRRKKQQYIDRLKLRSEQIARLDRDKKDPNELTGTEKLIYKSGMNSRGKQVLQDVLGKEPEARDVAELSPHDVVVLNREGADRSLSARDVALNYPEGADTWKKLQLQKHGELNGPAYAAYYDDLKTRMDLAAEKATVSSVGLRGKDLEEAVDTAKRQAALAAFDVFASEIKNKYFSLDSVDLNAISGLSTKERELASHLRKLYNEYTNGGTITGDNLIKKYILSTTLRQKFLETAPFSLQKSAHPLYARQANIFGSIPSNEYPEVIWDKLVNAAVVDFNMKFGRSSLGVEITPDDPAIAALGIIK